MQPITEPIAPLGSQRWLDQLNLAYHREVATQLLADPEAVLAIARENLRRWLSDGPAPWFEEWEQLLVTCSLSELLVILTEDSDEGQRLRQSTPFTGILSATQRQELRRKHEEATAF